MAQNEKYTDNHLIVGIKETDRTAYTLLYDTYAPLLFSLIKNMLKEVSIAEEVLQSTFIKIYADIQFYNSSYLKLYSWMYIIARDLATERRKTMLLIAALQFQEDYDQISRRIILNVVLPPDTFDNKINQLTNVDRAIFELICGYGYPVAKVCEKLNLSVVAVSVALRRVINNLKMNNQILTVPGTPAVLLS